MLQVGDCAPDFELRGSDGLVHSLSSFSKLVLYFYPKDMTSGCTLQARGYQALAEEFFRRGIAVVGVSGDGLDRHRKFIEKEGLGFLLLADEDFDVSKRYGVYGPKRMYGREYFGIHRSSFYLVDGVVKIVRRDVKAGGDASEMLKEIDRGA